MELQAQNARFKLRAMGFGCLLFTVVGFAMILTEPRYSSDWWAGIAGAVLFSFCGWVLLYRSFSTGPALTISREGILDTRVVDALIPWVAVASVSERVCLGQHFVALYLSMSPKHFIHSPAKKILGCLNRPFGFGDIYISLDGLDKSAQEIRLAIAQHKEFAG